MDAHPLFAEAVHALGRGDHSGLRALLDRAPELVLARTEPPMSATLLHYSSFNGTEELAFDAPAETPDLARLLCERGAEADACAFEGSRSTPLCWALSSWFTRRIQSGLADAYLDAGAAIEGLDGDGAPLGHAIAFGYTRSVEHLARRGARTDHVVAAAALGDVERITSWLRTDGTFAEEALGFTRGEREEAGRFSWPPRRDPDPVPLALVTAATHGRTDVVRVLLDAGADPNVADSNDQTALHFAAYVGHPDVVELLLERAARNDIRERQFDRTAAEWARETGEDVLAARIERT